MKRGSEEAAGQRGLAAETQESVSRGRLTHKNLEIWKLGIDIVELIYKITGEFPQRDLGLISDMRRAAISVPSNIAEGAARNSVKDFIRFLYISLGSLSELETQITIMQRPGYVDDINGLLEIIEKERRKLLNYIKYQKERG